MINLLNPENITELKAARLNLTLRYLVILTFLSLCIIGAMYYVGFGIADNQLKEAITKQSTSEGQLASYQTSLNEAKVYQANLSVAKKILGNEVVFSTILTDIATALPPNAILKDLSLSSSFIGGVTNGKPATTQITALAKNYDAVLALKNNLEKLKSVFSEVRLTSSSLVAADEKNEILRQYPYTVTLTVIIAPKKGSL